MHYERAPRFRRSRLDEAPPPLRYAVQGFAPLRRRYGVGSAKVLQEDIGKSAGRMALYLEGKIRVDANDFPPRRQLK